MIIDIPAMLIIPEIDVYRGVYCFGVYRYFLYCLFSSIVLSRNDCAVLFPAGNSLRTSPFFRKKYHLLIY
ncbi:hypothetical protein DWW69_13660 [Bacteroides sp. AF16-49]|nr:hypothetical protein DXB63_12165 [Bacteroides sp. OM05-12]RHR73886.1 hypothetical protein DWW69_13660 [Bacteroides sp. AF16-49]